MRRTLPIVLVALASCGSPDQPNAPQASETTAEPAAAPTGSPSPLASEAALTPPVLTPVPQPQNLAVLDSRDCGTVAHAYFDALARGDFAFAARVWNDPVIDDARLRALFHDYKQPVVTVSDLRQEGAAGSLYCTVTGKLTDGADASKPPRTGEIVLKRVNDVPGATPAQLRWTIRSNTFIEKLQRSTAG
jgi:hypothetical protein